MVNWKLVFAGISILAALYLSFFFLPGILGIKIEVFSYPLVYLAIILTGILISISGFLPYSWGKFLRYIAYLGLFILILVLEINVMKIVLTKYPAPEIELEACKTLFGEKDKPESLMDAVGFWSCVTTGYFPSEKEKADLGWTMFAIFYIILPFAFIWTFLYGTMNGINLGDLFGNFGKPATIILSFIISMYATRQIFGFFLLDMFGYGSWGLAGIFIAAALVKMLENIIERFLKIEEYGARLEDAIKTALEIEKDAKKALYIYVKGIRNYRPPSLYNALRSIVTAGTLPYQAYSNLSSALKSQVEQTINNIISGRARIKDLLDLLKT